MRSMLAMFVAMLMAPLFSGTVNAEDAYPSKPIKIIVPVGAGAGVDTAARITGEAVEKHLGQRLVVENKPGAGLRLGAALVAKAEPDGYTLLFTSPTPVAVVEHFKQRMDYDPAKDFRPIAIGMFQPVLLIVRPGLGVKSVDEFVALAKAQPGKLLFGIQGIGGEMHLSMKHFEKMAGILFTQLPYNAAAGAIVDLLADRLDAMFLVIPPIRDHIQTGKLLALATLNARRVAIFPEIQTMTELGHPELTNSIWFGYLAPAKTPEAVVKRLADAFAKLPNDAALAKRVADLGAELRVVGPQGFAEIIASDRATYGKIVQEGNLSGVQ